MFLSLPRKRQSEHVLTIREVANVVLVYVVASIPHATCQSSFFEQGDHLLAQQPYLPVFDCLSGRRGMAGRKPQDARRGKPGVGGAGRTVNGGQWAEDGAEGNEGMRE
jgi:hypothetical protein